jgi:predicted nuclease of restriction endonuclease-like RecB superfamily
VLTSDLLAVTSRGGQISPRTLDAAKEEPRELAAALIELFRRCLGRPAHHLEGELRDFLGNGTAFLRQRGLAKLLRDRCTFEPPTEQEPEELRRVVFKVMAEHRSSRERFDRQAVLAEAAERLGLESEAVEAGLYGDLQENQVLTGFQPPPPEELLHRYNSALAQGILLRAREVKIEIRGASKVQLRALFRKIKFFQLLHRIELLPEGARIRLDGPLSLFRANTRYGFQMASFLPTLLHFPGWTLEARLLWGRDRQERLFRLVAGDGLRPFTRLTGQWLPEELTFLPERFAKVEGPWRLSTDTAILPLGGQGVLIPDYVFRHQETGQEVFMEIFGFWNRGALLSRLELLQAHGPKNLILGVGRGLATDPEALKELPGEVYVFRTAPIAREVRKLLDGFGAS